RGPDLGAELHALFEDDHLVKGAVPFADEAGPGFDLRGGRSQWPTGGQVGGSLLETSQRLLVEPAVDLLLHPVGEGVEEELSADADRAGGLVELDPALLELGTWEIGEGLQGG